MSKIPCEYSGGGLLKYASESLTSNAYNIIVFPDHRKIVEASLVIGSNFCPLLTYALDNNRDSAYIYVDATTNTIKTVVANTTYTVKYRYFTYE